MMDEQGTETSPEIQGRGESGARVAEAESEQPEQARCTVFLLAVGGEDFLLQQGAAFIDALVGNLPFQLKPSVRE